MYAGRAFAPLTAVERELLSKAPGDSVLSAALEGRVRDLLALLMSENPELTETPPGERFAVELAECYGVSIGPRRYCFRSNLTPGSLFGNLKW